MLNALTRKLESGKSLSPVQVEEAIALLTAETESVSVKAEFLTALARKGESVEEIAAFASAMSARSVAVELPAELRSREILDVVGTGGDQLGTFNISSTVAILCAAAGVIVAKHGNRAVTSPSGSADVLETLGIGIGLAPADAAKALMEHGFAFFFAPNYHPAFKNIIPARKLCAERRQRTIFNILGPLLNPARPSAQLLGVARPELCEPMAHVLQSLGLRRGMVVCGSVGGSGQVAYFDELSTLAESTVAEFYQDRGFSISSFVPDNLPLQPVTLEDLRGGDKFANAETVRRILGGDERGPKRDAVLLNAGAALFVAGRTRSIGEGWELAAQTIDGGAAARKLAELTA